MGVEPTHFDVAIVGGGLAGLTLSIQLAKQGRKVILLEKEAYPYHKVCGEYIAMESWEYLERCNIPLSTLNLPRIRTLQLSSPNGNFLTHTLNPGGFGISRFTLDYLLAIEAKKMGVVLLEHCKVDEVLFKDGQFCLESKAGNFTADFAFGAYGKRSNLDLKQKRKFALTKQTGANNYIGVKYHIQIQHAEDLIALHNFEDGYCGISKVDLDRYCLCYLTTAANLKANENSIPVMEQKVLHQNPHLKRIWQEATFLYKEPLTISQIRFEPRTQIENHFVLLGDAAGLITPLCGNGMSMAMHAAKLAAELLPDHPKDRAIFEKSYQKAWQQTFGIRIKAGRTFQSLFGSSRITNTVIATLKTFPSLLKPLISLTHGNKF
jgi:flavin-dependent dehydrogenase